MITYIIYGFIFSLILCGYCNAKFYAHQQKNYYKYLLVLLFFSFIIFTSFRVIFLDTDDYTALGGIDATSYKKYFENANLSLKDYYSNNYSEPLYELFVWLTRKISSDFRLFLTIYYTIIFTIQIKILSKIKISKSVFISYFAVCFLLIVTSFSAMRNVLSVFVSWMAFMALDEKNYTKSFLWITVSSLIHYSAVICFPMWFICCLSERKDGFSLKKAFQYWGGGVMLIIMLLYFLPNLLLHVKPEYIHYLNQPSEIAINQTIGRSIIVLLVILKFKDLIRHNSMNRIMFIALLVTLYVPLLQIMLPIMYRMLLFGNLATFFLISELIAVFPLNRKRFLMNFCINSVLLFYLLLTIISFSRNALPSYGLNYVNSLF